MPTRIHLGPDFEDFTMTSGNFRWLHSCRWEASHFNAFLSLRTRISHNLAKSPNLVKSKDSYIPSTNAQWILAGDDDEAHAWAELQGFPSTHDKFGLLFWGMKNGEAAFSEMHLTRLLSFCLLIGKFDHIKVVAFEEQCLSLIEGIGKSVGELRNTYTFCENSWYPSEKDPLVKLKSLEIARDEWVASPLSDKSDATLQMISARIKRFERAQELLAPKRKRRSLLARLFNPKIDDAFF